MPLVCRALPRGGSVIHADAERLLATGRDRDAIAEAVAFYVRNSPPSPYSRRNRDIYRNLGTSATLAVDSVGRFLSVTDAASLLGVSPRRVRDIASTLPGAYRLPNGRWRLPESEVLDLAERRTDERRASAPRA
ncbi:helix-turn-helix transcriptional regulator [Streptomyces albogriseolus]|uniref:helix-turn-helix transcriptional regulator n=1 Tax=Streptomyces albogriseolus TaxID=1887 RepID=UPI0038101C31